MPPPDRVRISVAVTKAIHNDELLEEDVSIPRVSWLDHA